MIVHFVLPAIHKGEIVINRLVKLCTKIEQILNSWRDWKARAFGFYPHC